MCCIISNIYSICCNALKARHNILSYIRPEEKSKGVVFVQMISVRGCFRLHEPISKTHLAVCFM